MRKRFLALLILPGLAAAQKIPLLHRDPLDTQRTQLREKLTRLAETRKSLDMPELQPASAAELDTLTTRTEQRRSGGSVAQRRTKAKTVAAAHAPATGKPIQRNAGATEVAPGTEFVHSPASDEVSLGQAARQYRAQKQQAHSKTN